MVRQLRSPRRKPRSLDYVKIDGKRWTAHAYAYSKSDAKRIAEATRKGSAYARVKKLPKTGTRWLQQFDRPSGQRRWLYVVYRRGKAGRKTVKRRRKTRRR